MGCSGEKKALWPKQRETWREGEMQVEKWLDRHLDLKSISGETRDLCREGRGHVVAGIWYIEARVAAYNTQGSPTFQQKLSHPKF